MLRLLTWPTKLLFCVLMLFKRFFHRYKSSVNAKIKTSFRCPFRFFLFCPFGPSYAILASNAIPWIQFTRGGTRVNNNNNLNVVYNNKTTTHQLKLKTYKSTFMLYTLTYMLKTKTTIIFIERAKYLRDSFRYTDKLSIQIYVLYLRCKNRVHSFWTSSPKLSEN